MPISSCARETREAVRALYSPSAFPAEAIEERVYKGISDKRANPISLEEFKKNYPFNPDKILEAQTWTEIDGDYFRIQNYDPATGNVALVRMELKDKTLGDLKKILKEDYSRIKIKPGKILTVNRKDYKIIGVDPWHKVKFDNERVVHLAQEVRMTVPLSALEQSDRKFVKLIDVSRKEQAVPLLGKNFEMVNDNQAKVSYLMGAPHPDPFKYLHDELKLPADYPIRIKYDYRNAKNIQLKDLKKQDTEKLFKIWVYDKATPPNLISYFERIKGVKKGDPQFLTELKPVDSHVYQFRLGTGTDAKEIKVFAPKSGSQRQDARDFKKITELLEKTPLSLKDLIEEIRFDPGGLSSEGFAGSTGTKLTFYNKIGKIYSTHGVVANIMARDGVDGTYWHELGHHLQPEAIKRIANFDWSLWEDAIIRDQEWVTPYASTQTSEDFPETLLFYVQTQGGKLDPEARAKFANRFALLDRLL